MHAIIAGLHHDELRRVQAGDVFSKRFGEGSGGERRVLHLPASLLAKLIAEVTHRAEEEDNTRLVAPNVSGLLVNFGHPNTIALGVKVVEGRRGSVQLIAQHHN